MGAHDGQAALLEAFRKPGFDVAVFVRDATSQGADRVAKLTQQLEDCATTFDEDLRKEIVACHEELLQNAGRVGGLDGQIGQIRDVVDGLKASIARLKGDVLSPFEGVKRRAVLLERMQAVNVLIRKLLRFLFDARKLRSQMEAPSKDFSKAAHTLQEIEGVLQDGGLERLDILRAEIVWIREVSARIRKQAEDDLRSGVKSGNQISLNVALQVFFNLHCLWPQLRRLLREMLDDFSQVALPAGAGFHQALEMNMQVLVAQTQRVHLLDEMVRSKTDPLTQRTFLSVIEAEGVSSLTTYFFGEAASSLKAKLARVSQDRAARRALVTDSPKILRAMSEAMDKVNMAGRARGPVLRAAEREALFGAAGELRNEFLREFIRKVTEPVEMMLSDRLLEKLAPTGELRAAPGPTGAGAAGAAGDAAVADELPTSHDLKRYAQLLVSELERCEACPDLLLKEAVRSARSSVLLFATRLERVVDTSCTELRCFEDEAQLKLRSPLPAPAAGHARNARLFGIAHHTLAALRDTVPERLQSSIFTPQVQTTLQQTQAAIIAPMVASLRRAVSSATSRMEHLLEGRGDGGAPALLAVSQVCTHVGGRYFSLFGAGQLLPYTKELCVFVVRSFLSAAAIVRPPVGKTLDHVRKALAQDMQAVEAALSALDVEFQTRVRHEAAVFREFRRLVCAPSLEAVDFDSLANVIPMHLLLTYLVHQLPEQVPSLPAFCGVPYADYLEGTLMPLWEDQKEAGMKALKAKVGELTDKFELDPGESTVVAFIVAQTA